MPQDPNLLLNSQDLQKVDEFRQSCDTAILTILFVETLTREKGIDLIPFKK